MNPATIGLIEALAPLGEKLVEDIVALFQKHTAAGTTPSTAEVQQTVNSAITTTAPNVTAPVAAATAPTPSATGVIFQGSKPIPDYR